MESNSYVWEMLTFFEGGVHLPRVQSPIREGDIIAAPWESGSAKERESDEVEACYGHEGGRHGLVAAAEGDDGVGKVSLVHDLDAVGDGVPGDEGVPHGLGAVRQTVTEEKGDLFVPV